MNSINNLKINSEIVIKMHYSAINVVGMRWIYYDRPCNFEIQRSKKNQELIGVKLKISNEATFYFINCLLDEIKDSELFVR